MGADGGEGKCASASISGSFFHLPGPRRVNHEECVMTKPDVLKGDIKSQAQEADRHNLARPAVNGALWARGLTTQRVADLFRTLPGLPGHWMQLQNEVNAGNRYFYGVQNGHQTTEEGKALIRWIADAVVSAAGQAGFDFPLQQLRFTADTGWLKLYRVGGRVLVLSRP
ncbi:hypothetical protein FEQ05_02866 [Burkholderia pseudomultivorans]|uniref:Peptide ABC transporter ATPase n=2 Tax=Burkholderia pseudomultivorans TaxID=1207504 RepID=A0A6P2KHU0_9BURK|nr:hypothetical protein [Burkholderia pseudomultivorans]MDR8737235.1 hypothetical protein [Burkholderia pseudomultivorans]MDR8743228.1 hypothetical protein [Burkholderia pseudomultivorans]MDR8754795.1 hypothetical protein [Burkholderia pseudomultivorans]MDR8779930.1 hypothetical protein [Burkholderia pseudomultivorans]